MNTRKNPLFSGKFRNLAAERIFFVRPLPQA